MNWVDFLFSFRGRVRRLHFWLYLLCLSVISTGAIFSIDGPQPDFPHYMNGLMLTYHTPFVGEHVIYSALSLAILWSKFAVLTKRWHDREKSGWWSLIMLVPVIGWFWIVIECGFMEGTLGANRYGLSPKGPVAT